MPSPSPDKAMIRRGDFVTQFDLSSPYVISAVQGSASREGRIVLKQEVVTDGPDGLTHSVNTVRWLTPSQARQMAEHLLDAADHLEGDPDAHPMPRV